MVFPPPIRSHGARWRAAGLGRRVSRALVFAALALSTIILAGACSGRGDGTAAMKQPRVILLRDGSDPSSGQAVVAATELPAFASVASLPQGSASLADRLVALLGGAGGGDFPAAVVAMRPQKGMVDAVRKTKDAAAGATPAAATPAAAAVAAGSETPGETLAAPTQADTRKPIWILVSPLDDPLATEAFADLVVDLAPAQTEDPAFEKAFERGLCELARRAAIGKARIDDAAEIAAALRSSGGYDWKVEYRVDQTTGIKARNHVVVSAKPRG
ncbi:MAG TPA: hypothetical protein VMV44_16475 [Rectinemataceae bacterium]|nr:hypothetical protein [Rectinemataceae bacterium]